jgi:hypothetical protein
MRGATFDYEVVECWYSTNQISLFLSNEIVTCFCYDKDEILANHRSFMTSLNIPSGKESEDLP